jgi:hypothetical protein
MYGQMNAVASGIVEGLDEDGVSEVLGGVGSVGLDKNWDVVLRMLDASAPVSMMSQMTPCSSAWSSRVVQFSGGIASVCVAIPTENARADS